MRAMVLVLLACLLLASPASKAETLPLKDPGEVKDLFYANPLPVRDIGDPFLVRTGDGYRLFATGGPIGFNTWSSGDLKAFDKAKALKKLDWASGDYWAPEVYPFGERWVMLYTARCKENGSLRTGIAFADAPEGPYTDPLGRPLMDFGYATIDATLVWDDGGQPYMIYVRDCSENTVGAFHESHIYGIRLAPDLLSVQGEPVLLLRPEGEWETRSGDTRWNEGPAVVRHGGKYYLFYSANGYFMKEYSVMCAVASSPLGPYTRQSDMPLLRYAEDAQGVLVSGPGHNAFFEAGDELFTAYHTHTYPLAPSGNRQLCIDRAGFHADGSAFLCGPTLAPQLRPLADLGLVSRLGSATPSGEGCALLTDGDTCVSPASSAWVWEGTEAIFTFDAPVPASLLLVYPAPGEALHGTVTVNGSLTAALETEGSGLPGECLILPFEPLSVSSLSLSFPSPARLGEIVLAGPAD